MEYCDSMKRRLNSSGNAVDLETTLQFRGITDIIVVAGLTVGNISRGNFDRIDRTVFDLIVCLCCAGIQISLLLLILPLHPHCLVYLGVVLGIFEFSALICP